MAAKYREIASELAARIRRGDIAHRDRLPSDVVENVTSRPDPAHLRLTFGDRR